MIDFKSNSLAGIIRFPVINENPDRFNKEDLAKEYIVQEERALVQGGILQFWVPNKHVLRWNKVVINQLKEQQC